MRLGLSILVYCSVGLCYPGSARAQECPRSGFGIETNVLAGKVIKHSKKFTTPIPFLSTAVDVNFVWKTYGKKEWQQRRNYPQIGIGITATDYGSSKVLGNCIGIYPNLQVPIIKGDKAELTLRIGNGLGYVTRKYQRTTPVDTVNTAIGSNFNDFAIFMIDARHHFNDHWHLQYGINLTHISNAGTKLPNQGVNMTGMHVGVMYYPGSCKPQPLARELPKLPNRWLFSARMDISYKQARAAGMPYLPSYMPSVFVSHRWLSKNKYYFGADYAFHNDVLAFMRYYDVHNLPGEEGRQRRESWDGDVFIGNEFLMGKLGLVTQFGVQYKQTFLKIDRFTQKLGFNYYIMQHEKGLVKELFISALLLTHWTTAELFEYGVGVSF